MGMLYLLAYVLIGAVAGLAATKFLPSVPARPTPLILLGIGGALIGGLAGVAVVTYGRGYDYLYGYTHVANDGRSGATVPAYWMSLISAIFGAVTVLAVYKFIKFKRTDVRR